MLGTTRGYKKLDRWDFQGEDVVLLPFGIQTPDDSGSMGDAA